MVGIDGSRQQNDRRNEEKPKLMAFTTNKAKQLPYQTLPVTDMLKPKRVKDCKDRLNPEYAILSDNSCKAARAIDLVGTEKSKQDVSRTNAKNPTHAWLWRNNSKSKCKKSGIGRKKARSRQETPTNRANGPTHAQPRKDIKLPAFVRSNGDAKNSKQENTLRDAKRSTVEALEADRMNPV